MPSPTLVVTCGDHKYFDLLRGCIGSIRENGANRDFDLAFLDVGCTPAELAWIHEQVVHVSTPRLHFPTSMEVPRHIMGLLARPFLRDYFPGYQTYLWLDADTWVQRWEAVEWLIRGSIKRTGMAVVPEIDRCSNLQYGGLPAYWRLAFRWYAEHFGTDVADKLHSMPMLNAGVFAIHQNAPHWRIWSDSISIALRSKCSTITDQIALNFSIYARGLFSATELLPVVCNWTCHSGFPAWDQEKQEFVEPYLPHTSVGILHLTARDKTADRDIRTLSGDQVRMRVCYPPSQCKEQVSNLHESH